MADSVRIKSLNKSFTSPDDPSKLVQAVRDATLDIAPGELVTLLGPSGCGKTTLLRMVAGFEEPTSGDIFFDNRRMNDVAPNRRDATMVFQSYAIFPHLDVFENVAFGLRLTSLSRAEVDARVSAVIEQTGLTPMARRAPSQLSGGQQQRVALARAIVMEPRVLLFDEPLSNLDAKLRDQMRVEIRDLQQRVGITSLYVTHDQVEAMSISDRIVVMNQGRIEQVGTPLEIYASPATRFVAGFIGKANFVRVDILDSAHVGFGGLRIPASIPGAATGARDAMIRPEAISLSDGGEGIEGTIARAMFVGGIVEYLVSVPELGPLLVDVPNPAQAGLLETGKTVRVNVPAGAIHVFE